MCRSLQPCGHVDAVALFEGHDGLLEVRLLARPAAERLELALAHQRVDRLHLHVEQLLDRFLDLRLGRGRRDLEDDLIMLGGRRRLLGDHRSDDDVVQARIVRNTHLNRASRASTAALVSTSFCRRRMSYTLMPCTGSTSMFGMLRAARPKFSSIVSPPMISAFASPSFSNCAVSALVLASLAARSASTTMPPSFALAESACRSASARIFFGKSIAGLRGVGPNERPPPRNRFPRAEPWRAPPVPFCAYIFLPVRQISARFFTACVPARRLASCQTMQRWIRSVRGSRPKMSLLSETEPASLPSSVVTLRSITRPLLAPGPQPRTPAGTCRASAGPSAGPSSRRPAP